MRGGKCVEEEKTRKCRVDIQIQSGILKPIVLLRHPEGPTQDEVSVIPVSCDEYEEVGVLFAVIGNVKPMHCASTLGSCREVCVY